MKLLDTTVVIDIDRGGSEALNKVFYLLPVTPEIAIKAAEIGTYLISQGKEVDIMDTYIASTAIIHRLTLVTTNIAHYEEIDKQKNKNW